MGQNYSCKCTNPNDQKQGEIQLENKENLLVEKLEKFEEITPIPDSQHKAKASNPVNKTLEEIINTNDNVVTESNKQVSTRQTEITSNPRNNVLPETSKKLIDIISPKSSHKTSSKKSKDKSISPISHPESISSKNSKQKASTDLKKISANQKQTIPNPIKKNFDGAPLKIPQLNLNSAPLEIINEYHRENSAEALTDNNKFSKNNESMAQEEGKNLNIVDNFELPSQEIPHNEEFSMNHKSCEKQSLKQSPEARSQAKYSTTMQQNNPNNHVRRSSRDNDDPSNSSCFLKKQGNSNLIQSDEFDGLKNAITNRNGKVTNYSKDMPISEKIKMIEIFTLFPENRLLSAGDEDVLYQSELLKYSKPEIYFASPFSSKYCVLSRSSFRYFKSKEAFFRLCQPLFTIPVVNFEECIFLKQESDSKKGTMYLFTIKTKGIFQKPNVWLEKQTSKMEQNSVDLYASINADNVLEKIKEKASSSKKEDKKAKKIQLLNSIEKLKESTNNPKDREEEGSTFIFGSKTEENVLKWVKIVNFVMNKD